MPRVTAKPRWRDDEVVVAWGALAAAEYVIARGERLRGSDPRVREHPEMFVADGTPESEWPSQVDWGALPSTPEPPQTRILESASADELCVANDSLRAGTRVIERGQKVRRDDPVVLKSPELFHGIPKLLSEGG